MDQPILAASALVVHQGKILFVRSTTTQGKWAFPGGKQKKNEVPQQTASREIKEELGIEISIKRELGSYVHLNTNQKFEIRCFVAETGSFDLETDPQEIIEAKWCTLKEGLALNLTSTTREALEKFASERHIANPHWK